MAEPLFLPSSGIGSSPDSLSLLFSGLSSRHSFLPVTRSISRPSRHFSPRFSPLYFPVPFLLLPYPFPVILPRILARSLFIPVPVCPPSHPRVRFSCRFHAASVFFRLSSSVCDFPSSVHSRFPSSMLPERFPEPLVPVVPGATLSENKHPGLWIAFLLCFIILFLHFYEK